VQLTAPIGPPDTRDQVGCVFAAKPEVPGAALGFFGLEGFLAVEAGTSPKADHRPGGLTEPMGQQGSPPIGPRSPEEGRRGLSGGFRVSALQGGGDAEKPSTGFLAPSRGIPPAADQGRP
jgi:hypothetical protein